MSFSGKNDAESSINFVKIPFLDPKCAKLDQKSWFGHVRTCQVVIWTCPDLPRPVQEDKYLLQTSGHAFIFSEITPFNLLFTRLCFLIKSQVLLSKLITFYQIIGFNKRIYDFSIKSSVLLREFIICYKIIGFTEQIYYFL